MGEVSCCALAPGIFFSVSKVNELSKYVLVHRSDVISGPDPTWKPVTISVRSL